MCRIFYVTPCPNDHAKFRDAKEKFRAWPNAAQASSTLEAIVGKLITDQKDAALRVQSLLVLTERENASNHDFYLHRSPISSWWTSRWFPQFADRKKKFPRWRACLHIPKSAGIRVRCRNITNITPISFIIVETTHGEPATAYQTMSCLPIWVPKYENILWRHPGMPPLSAEGVSVCAMWAR